MAGKAGNGWNLMNISGIGFNGWNLLILAGHSLRLPESFGNIGRGKSEKETFM